MHLVGKFPPSADYEVKKRGYEVHVIAPFQEGHAKYARFLAHHQIIVHSLALERASISPFSDIKYFFSLVKIFLKRKV